VIRRMCLSLVLLLLVGACASEPAAEDDAPADGTVEDTVSGEEASADLPGTGLRIVAPVFPLADIAGRIAPGADVTLLTSSGQDPHDLELSPADRALIETADIVLYMGEIGFQPQVESAVQDATGAVLSVASIAGEANLRDFEGHTHSHEDEGHGHGHGHEGEDEEEGHSGGDAVDPHIWFDARIMAEVAEELGEALALLDENQADAFQTNAREVHDQLLGLAEEIDTLLSGCAHEVAVVSHEAYAYLLEPRGLQQEGISGAGGHGEVSPQRLAELTRRIQNEGIPAVLAEPFEGRADAEALANEAGVDLLEIDPLEAGHDDLLDMGYLAALRIQAETFATALVCS